MYRKKLPVQKFVASLEKSFSEKTGIDRGSMEFAEAWEKEFERIKEEAAKEESFTDKFTKADLKGGWQQKHKAQGKTILIASHDVTKDPFLFLV